MPTIIGKSIRVVDTDGLTIDEFVGNVGTQEDTMSLAVVKVSQPCNEPWLTLDYDEWIAVLVGKIEFHFVDEAGSQSKLVARAGETVFVARGERFRPVFPVGGTEYVPVCIPAFKPERCLREDDGGINTSIVADNLKKLHAESTATNETKTIIETFSSSSAKTAIKNHNDLPDTVYHMCEKSSWATAVSSSKAYYPPTFEKDGHFTHATAIPERLLETANHFYTDSHDEWICLEINAQVLRDQCGIITTYEEPRPVGEQDVQVEWKSSQWLCPHIYGGIPTSMKGIVTGIYPMKRNEEGQFLSIVGLTDS